MGCGMGRPETGNGETGKWRTVRPALRGLDSEASWEWGLLKDKSCAPRAGPSPPCSAQVRTGTAGASLLFFQADLEEQERSRCARRDRDQESRGDGRASQRASNSELPCF